MANDLMSHPVAKFFTRQLQLNSRSKYGCRYSVQDKNFPISLYYASPKAYRLCVKNDLLAKCVNDPFVVTVHGRVHEFTARFM